MKNSENFDSKYSGQFLNPNLSKGQLLEIEKAKKDLAKLTQKVITDKRGHQRKVWVKMGEEVKQEKPTKTEDSKEIQSILAEKLPKSTKAKKLAELGVSTSEIAKKLDMHYSHAYSATKGVKKKEDDKGTEISKRFKKIYKKLEESVKEYGGVLSELTPKEFNDGFCDHFAEVMSNSFDDVNYMSTDDLLQQFPDIPAVGHAFIEFQGKYYDMENLDGVKSPLELNFYKRAIQAKKVVEKKSEKTKNEPVKETKDKKTSLQETQKILDELSEMTVDQMNEKYGIEYKERDSHFNRRFARMQVLNKFFKIPYSKRNPGTLEEKIMIQHALDNGLTIPKSQSEDIDQMYSLLETVDDKAKNKIQITSKKNQNGTQTYKFKIKNGISESDKEDAEFAISVALMRSDAIFKNVSVSSNLELTTSGLDYSTLDVLGDFVGSGVEGVVYVKKNDPTKVLKIPTTNPKEALVVAKELQKIKSPVITPISNVTDKYIEMKRYSEDEMDEGSERLSSLEQAVGLTGLNDKWRESGFQVSKEQLSKLNTEQKNTLKDLQELARILTPIMKKHNKTLDTHMFNVAFDGKHVVFFDPLTD